MNLVAHHERAMNRPFLPDSTWRARVTLRARASGDFSHEKYRSISFLRLGIRSHFLTKIVDLRLEFVRPRRVPAAKLRDVGGCLKDPVL